MIDHPVVSISGTTPQDLRVFFNGLEITKSVMHVTIDACVNGPTATCRLDFRCTVATGLTPEEKIETVKGLRSLLSALEAAEE